MSIFIFFFSCQQGCAACLPVPCFRREKWLLLLSLGRCRFHTNCAVFPGENNEALLPSLPSGAQMVESDILGSKIYLAVTRPWEEQSCSYRVLQCPGAVLGLASPDPVLRRCQEYQSSIRAADTWPPVCTWTTFTLARSQSIPSWNCPCRAAFSILSWLVELFFFKDRLKGCFSFCWTPPSVIGREKEPSSRKSLKCPSTLCCGQASTRNFSRCALGSCSVHFCFIVLCGNLGNLPMETAWHRVLKQDLWCRQCFSYW